MGEVYLESKESVMLAKLALSKLENSKKAGLADDDYKEYRNQLMDLLAEAEKWATHRNEFIRKKSDGAQPSYDGPFPIGGPARLKK